MTPEDLRLSAEMCGVFTGARRHHPIIWEPHKNPAQWQECILKLLEHGDFRIYRESLLYDGDDGFSFAIDCSPLEFPVLALAELKRRMK